MPHGVIVSLSPHASFFDTTLANECAEGIKKAIQDEAEHAENVRQLEAARRAADVLLYHQQVQATEGEAALAAAGSSMAGDSPVAGGIHHDADGAEAAAQLSASMYSQAIGMQQPVTQAVNMPQPSTQGSPAPPAPPQPPSPHAEAHGEAVLDHPLCAAADSCDCESEGVPGPTVGSHSMSQEPNGGQAGSQGALSGPAIQAAAPVALAVAASQQGPTGGEQHAADGPEGEPGHCPKHLSMRRLQGTGLYDWQRIFISMKCMNPKKQLQCEPAAIKRFSFYGAAPMDMPLLHFFLAAAPAPHKRCPAVRMMHVRYLRVLTAAGAGSCSRLLAACCCVF